MHEVRQVSTVDPANIGMVVEYLELRIADLEKRVAELECHDDACTQSFKAVDGRLEKVASALGIEED